MLVIGFAVACPNTQPPVRLAHRADTLMSAGEIDAVLVVLTTNDEAIFPPGWRPLPIYGLPIKQPDLLDVAEHALALPANAWARNYYLSEVKRIYLGGALLWGPQDPDRTLARKRWLRVEAILGALPDSERSTILRENRDMIDRMRSQFDLPRPNELTVPTTLPTTQTH